MSTVEIIPFAAEARREQSRRELIDIMSRAHFWRMRAVELTLLSLIAFSLGFAIACRL